MYGRYTISTNLAKTWVISVCSFHCIKTWVLQRAKRLLL